MNVLLEFKVRVNEDTKVFYIILLFNRFVINKYRNGFSELFLRRKLVLSIFRDNLLQQSQLWILFNSKLTFVLRDSKDGSAKNKLESSANR